MSDRPAADSGVEAGFAIRLDRCIGCWACAVACRMENDLAEGSWWISITTAREHGPGDEPGLTSHYEPVIEQCARRLDGPIDSNPPCVPACPTQALVWGDLADPSSTVGALAQRPEVSTGTRPTGSPIAIRYLPARTTPQRRSGIT